MDFFEGDLLRRQNSEMRDTHFSIVSRGKRASQRMESNSMPAKDIDVAGPQVFSGAMGIPRYVQSDKNNSTAADRVALKEQPKGNHRGDAKCTQFSTYYERPIPPLC